MIERQQLMIDNKWVDPVGAGSLSVVNPANEETFATVPAGNAEDIDSAVNAAAAAFDGWSQTSIDERAEVLLRIADILERRSEELTTTLVNEVGEPITFAPNRQTAQPIAHLRNTAASLREIEFESLLGTTLVHRAPAGVVGAITPWNVPLLMTAMKVGAALAAGCTVVVKPTEVTPLSSFLFAEAVVEAGVPEGVVNVVSGTGAEAGEALASHPLVDVLSLTGSLRAGRRVMELASRRVARVSLELGGKSANVILGDADLEAAITSGIDDAFRLCGQVCGGLTRVLVPRSRLAEAEAFAVARAEEYVIGDPMSPATTLGPLTNSAQRERVRGLIMSGREEGARLVTGGEEAPDGFERGYFVRPTIFSGHNHLRIAREEIFGPVVVLIPFDNYAEAVQTANDSDYGLAGAVWSADRDRAVRVAKRLRTGRVRINGSTGHPLAPHGGFKMSGIGRENGTFGIEEFLEYQAIG